MNTETNAEMNTGTNAEVSTETEAETDTETDTETSVWDKYRSRVTALGETQRERVLLREQRHLTKKVKNSLSYHSVLIEDEPREVSIINSDNLNEKSMFSLPGEDFNCGNLVDFADNKWLITEKDANNEVYTRVKIIQCNFLLRWIDENDKIQEQWCVIEDGTKYLVGEYEDRNFVVTRGDSRVAMTIGRNEKTVKFCRGMRFLIDDVDAEHKLAYLLTKPLKVGKTYNEKGIYAFVLQEVVSTDDDNMELGIADYYKHFSKTDDPGSTDGSDGTDDSDTPGETGGETGVTNFGEGTDIGGGTELDEGINTNGGIESGEDSKTDSADKEAVSEPKPAADGNGRKTWL